VVYKNQTVSVV